MSDDKEKVVNALGGTRGLIDSGLPALVFMVSFYVTKEIRPSVTYALILSAGLALARLIKKDTVQHALSGLFGVAICAFFATKTGKAENFYLPGLIINVVYGTLYLFLNLIKLPILGLMLGPILGENLAWRKDPIRRAAYIKAGWLWVGLFLDVLQFNIRFIVLEMLICLALPELLWVTHYLSQWHGVVG